MNPVPAERRTLAGKLWEGRGQGEAGRMGPASTQSAGSAYAEISANGVLALIAVASALLSRQLAAQERAFVAEGGFTERLYRVRSDRRSRG